MTIGAIDETAIGTPSFRFRPAAGLLLLWLALTLIAYGAGSVFMDYRVRRLDATIDETEAMLRFDHLQTFREMEDDLAAGCSGKALERTKRQIDEEMDLLAGFMREHQNTWAHGYIAKSDPELPGLLKTFRRSNPESRTSEPCKGGADRKAGATPKTAHR